MRCIFQIRVGKGEFVFCRRQATIDILGYPFCTSHAATMLRRFLDDGVEVIPKEYSHDSEKKHHEHGPCVDRSGQVDARDRPV